MHPKNYKSYKTKRVVEAYSFCIVLVSVNANLLLAACHVLELNSAVNKSEESVVRADTNVSTGMNLGSALSYENVAGNNCLTVSSLNAKTLGLGITTVLSRTYALFMSEEL